jgi:ATP-dependent helicase/DNAse subunit B
VLDAMKIDIKSNSEKQSKRLAGNLDGLIDYTISKVHGIGDSISSGDVSASPIFDGDIKACEYCDFNSVCKACDRPVSRRKLEKPPENWLKEEC